MLSNLSGLRAPILLAVALLLVVAWWGDTARLYEHPYFGFINPGPRFGESLLLVLGIWRGWRFFRGFAIARLGLAVVCYLLVSFQRGAWESSALILAAVSGITLMLLVGAGKGAAGTTSLRRAAV